MLTTNGGQERNQVWTLSLRRGKSSTQWRQNSTADSNEENEAHEEKTTGIESMVTSASADLTWSAPTSADDALAGAKIDNSDD
jgi:hypothetical protein